jgi:hypothetical protein
VQTERPQQGKGAANAGKDEQSATVEMIEMQTKGVFLYVFQYK